MKSKAQSIIQLKKSKQQIHLNNFEMFIADFRQIFVILKFIVNEFL
jgi:hypothetical protein